MATDWARWLNERTERYLRAPTPGRATLRIVRWEGRLVVAKDYFGATALYRRTVGRLLIGREARMYRRLHGCPGVPRMLARPVPDLLITEYVDGVDLRHIDVQDVDETAIMQLEGILGAMHGRRVVHLDLGHDHTGDLGRETNLVWTRDRRLFVVDLGGALVWPSPLAASLFRQFTLHDRLAVVKLKRRFFPSLLGPQDEALLRAIPEWQWRLLRRLRKV